jgi:hypothetical protein
MDEAETQQEPTEETQKEEAVRTETDTPKGDLPKKSNILDEANTLYQRLDERIKRYENLIERQEELMANQLLRGRSDATMGEQKPKEETPQEYKDRIMRNETFK